MQREPLSSFTGSSRPWLLCVDDEPQVLEGIRDRLRRSFDVRVAESGSEGLTILRGDPDAFAIVISDMRMPGMPGDAFLREARLVAPNAVRMLLTGHADVDAAVRAVNNAQLFRFLTKPCESEELIRACAAALGQHRLMTAERVLLKQTLSGTVDALAGTLALASPAAFGRGRRVKELASRLALATGARDRWEIEVAAMLAHIGAVTLPQRTAERWYAGESLDRVEHAMVARIPQVTTGILNKVPRLDGVLVILDSYRRNPQSDGQDPFADISEGARVLRIATDYDELESAGATDDVVLATMRCRGVYDLSLLEAFADVLAEVEQVSCPT